MHIIGLSGKIGVGKTTLANYMVDRLGDGWQRVAFGDVLKEEAAGLFGFPVDWAHEHKNWRWPVGREHNPPNNPDMSIREILQWYGTDVCRARNPHYWVEKMQSRIASAESNGAAGVVIDDCRFVNEINVANFRVRVRPYTMWRCDPATAAHESETALDGWNGWDLIITPWYGGLEDMADLVVAQAGVTV